MLSRKVLTFLLLSTLECVVLLFYRKTVNNSSGYEYLLINLFLAWIPLGFSTVFVRLATHSHLTKKNGTLFFCFVFWLLFFPNAPYLVTDIIHLKPQSGTAIWFDVLLLESFSFAGFFLTYISLFQIQEVFTKWMGKINAKYTSIALLYITSVGVSIGRFWRFNSWDALIAPWRISRDFVYLAGNPGKLLELMSFSTFFFFLLITLYIFLTVIREKKTLT